MPRMCKRRFQYICFNFVELELKRYATPTAGVGVQRAYRRQMSATMTASYNFYQGHVIRMYPEEIKQ